MTHSLTLSFPPLLWIYGGTFDPLHQGHIDIVEQLLRASPKSIVTIVPSHHAFHKKPSADFQHRVSMLQSVYAKTHNVRVSLLEKHHKKPLATVDCAHIFRTLFPRHSIHMVIGADVYASMPTWPRWRGILDIANLLVVPRKPQRIDTTLWRTPSPRVVFSPDTRSLHGSLCIWNACTPLAISSTQVRKQLLAAHANTQGTSASIPHQVQHYIHTHKLYQS